MIVDKQNFPFLLEYTHSDDVYIFYSFCYIDDENFYYLCGGQQGVDGFYSTLIIDNSNDINEFKQRPYIKRFTPDIYNT
jgi:hypothetical protein